MFECIKNLFKKKPVLAVVPSPVESVPQISIPVVVPEKPGINLEPGLALIKEFEGCVLQAYPDPGTGGAPWTIGWGHTGGDVYPGLVITQDQADDLFVKDIQPRVEQLKGMLQRQATDNQFCALLSFGYNCGMGALAGSKILWYFNQGQIQQAADQFQYWNHGGAGQVLPGLTRRRAEEAKLFLS